MTTQVPEKLGTLPDVPGVYYFLDTKGTVLYVGKATSLRSRVRSYFSSDLLKTRGPLVAQMLDKIADIKWEERDSVLEALVLEAYEIKRLQPDFNTRDKSQRSFVYLVITDEEFPRLIIKRERDVIERRIKEKVKYSFGPFSSKKTLLTALKIIRKIFPYRSLDKSYDEKSEFYRQIGLAPGTKQTKEEYLETIEQIKLFFEGKKKRVVTMLEKQMKEHAADLEFEKAEEVKRRIFALTHIQDVALLDDDLKRDAQYFRIEAYDVAHMAGDDMVGVMTVVNYNEADTDQYRKFNIKTLTGIDDLSALEELLKRRIAHPEWPLPDCILVDGGEVHKRRAETVLRREGISIPVVAAKKDKTHKVAAFIGRASIINNHKRALLLANSEAHRFAITFHRNKRSVI